MKQRERKNKPANKVPDKAGNKKGAVFQGRFAKMSAQARARMCKGRPVMFPESAILAKRTGVTRAHAHKVVRGTMRSRVLELELAKIRVELAGGAR